MGKKETDEDDDDKDVNVVMKKEMEKVARKGKEDPSSKILCSNQCIKENYEKQECDDVSEKKDEDEISSLSQSGSVARNGTKLKQFFNDFKEKENEPLRVENSGLNPFLMKMRGNEDYLMPMISDKNYHFDGRWPLVKSEEGDNEDLKDLGARKSETGSEESSTYQEKKKKLSEVKETEFEAEADETESSRE